MPDLQQTRHKMKLALGGMAAASAIAVVVLFSPLVGSTASRREQMDHLWADLKVKNQQVEPLRGMDKKVVTAQVLFDPTVPKTLLVKARRFQAITDADKQMARDETRDAIQKLVDGSRDRLPQVAAGYGLTISPIAAGQIRIVVVGSETDCSLVGCQITPARLLVK